MKCGKRGLKHVRKMERDKRKLKEGILLIKARDPSTVCNELSEAQADSNLRVVILELGCNSNDANTGKDIFHLISGYHVPVIASVSGLVTGWRLEAVIAAHLSYCSKDTMFDFDDCYIPSAMLDDKTRALLDAGRTLTSEQALRYSIINNLDSGQPNDIAHKTARRISQMAPLAIRACLKAVRRDLSETIEKGMERESLLFSKLFDSNDVRRGTAAFLNKERPYFEGN